MTVVRLDLPYLQPPLTANQRLHWARKAVLTKRCRETACWLAKSKKLPGAQRLTVTLHYRPKERRRRDAHNLYPTVKALVDGLVDAGVVPDDDTTHVSTPEPVIHEPAAKPGMWLELEYPEAS